jgi:cold-inducible RNA-binding protein
MTKDLFVGGFPYETTAEELSMPFREFGTVLGVKILVDRLTGRSRGIGFVEMSTSDEARAAMEKLNGAAFGSRKIFVSEARPQEKRPAGPAGKPGFVERRSGKDRRQARGASGGGEKRADKPGFPVKEGWEKRPSSGGGTRKWSGGRKEWEKRPAFGGQKPAWDRKPKTGGDAWRGERPGADESRREGFFERKKKWAGKPAFPGKKEWEKRPAFGGDKRTGFAGKKRWGSGESGGGPKDAWKRKPEAGGEKRKWSGSNKKWAGKPKISREHGGR